MRELLENPVLLVFDDGAGEEEFDAVTRTYYRGTAAPLFCCLNRRRRQRVRACFFYN